MRQNTGLKHRKNNSKLSLWFDIFVIFLKDNHKTLCDAVNLGKHGMDKYSTETVAHL